VPFLIAMDDPSVVEQFWPLAVTGTFALLGVSFGKAWERRGGSAAWLRAQRLEAYAGYLEAHHKFWGQAGTVYRLPLSDPSRPDAEEQLWEMMASIARGRARVDLVGPPSVARATQAWMDTSSEVRWFVKSNVGTVLLGTAKGRADNMGHDSFSTAARAVFQG